MYANRWSVIHATVEGAMHKLNNIENQDAICYWPKRTGQHTRMVLAIADGHGGGMAIRSGEGSKCAVGAARGLLQEFVEHLPQGFENQLSVYKAIAEERLPKSIVRLWQHQLDVHTQRSPISDEELGMYPGLDAARFRQASIQNPYLAYGTTLLAVAVTEAFIVYLQLGDGDILCVDNEGKISRPLPRDPRLIANETTSLSRHPNGNEKTTQPLDIAWKDFQVVFQPVAQANIAMILVATDGYANSFRDEAGFRKVAADLYETLQEVGGAEIEHNLQQWLKETSKLGSGDDITVGILYRPTIFTS